MPLAASQGFPCEAASGDSGRSPHTRPMNTELLDNPAERRKQVRLRVRPDLQISEQRYEGKVFHVVKDPVCLRYYRFNRQEYFVFQLFDGKHTMEEVQESFEEEFKPMRLEPQD